MAKANRLNKRRIDRIDQPGIYGDGNTLFLKVRDDGEGGRGSAQWVQIINMDGKRTERGLGGYPLVTLDEARQVAFENRRAVRRGDNPWADKDAAKVVPAAPTFEEALEAVLKVQREAWRNPKTEAQWRATMLYYAMPALGRMRVDAIQTPDVLACLERIWHTKRDTASRVKQRIHAVMQWAVAKGYRTDNPVAAVDAVLPKNGKTTKHRDALPYADVPSALAKLRDGNAHLAIKLALDFLVLTAARSGEVRKATWAEIDLEAGVWNVPAEHMKGGKAHTVPLSLQALTVLENAADEYGRDGIIFPSHRGKMLRDYALSNLLRDNDIAGVVHGFRSSFRDWAAEHGWERDIAEAALAHTVRNAVEAAYRRTKFLDKRRKMMERWGEHCMAAMPVRPKVKVRVRRKVKVRVRRK